MRRVRLSQRHRVASTGKPKQPFRTWAEAEARARELPGAHLTTAYQCPECGYWHVGREPMKKGRRR